MARLSKIHFTRQLGILNPTLIRKTEVTLIGTGSVGSFTALTLSKMGVHTINLYDDDIIESHNLPSSFFKIKSIENPKVVALSEILKEYTETTSHANPVRYVSAKLAPTVVVTPDSMSSRKLVWEQFKKQKQSINYIEARMGAELGVVYAIRKIKGKLSDDDIKFYEKHLFSDDQAKPEPCTARTIIYNVLMISSLICRAYKGILMEEKIPREVIFNMTSFDERTFMFTR